MTVHRVNYISSAIINLQSILLYATSALCTQYINNFVKCTTFSSIRNHLRSTILSLLGVLRSTYKCLQKYTISIKLEWIIRLRQRKQSD